MLRVLLWKEWRQQGAILIAILFVAAVTAVSLALANPVEWARRASDRGMGAAVRLAFLALLASQAVVTGAMLFAGEVEDGTLPYLDAHAGRRGPLWRNKMLAGISIVVISALGLGGGLIVLGLGGAAWLPACIWLGVDALAWTSVCSSTGRSTFRSIGIAVVILLVVSGLPAQLLADLKVESWLPYLLMKVPLLVLALALSHEGFCETDADRNGAIARLRQLAHPISWIVELRFRWSLGVGVIAVPLCAVLFIVGPVMLLWPLLTFALGCLAGVNCFAGLHADRGTSDGQAAGATAWGAAIGPWLVFAFVGAFLLFAISDHLLHYLQWTHSDPAADPMWFQAFMTPSERWAYRMSFVAIGFGFGQFFGQWTTRRWPALGWTMAVGAPVAALFYPSLLAGMALWKVWLVPATLLLATAVASRSHFGQPRARVRSAALFLVSAWLIFNLWWRVAEIPDLGPGFDPEAYRAEIANPHPVGDALRDAASGFAARKNEAKKLFPQLYKVSTQADPAATPTFDEFVSQVHDEGYPANDGVNGKNLDYLFEGQWVVPFREAALKRPDQLVELRRQVRFDDVSQVALEAGGLHLVRCLRRLRLNDAEGALSDLEVAFGVARHGLFRSAGWHSHAALGLERSCLEVARQALATPAGTTAKFRAELNDLVTRHETTRPSGTENLKSQWLLGGYPHGPSGHAEVGGTVVRALLCVPWERQRIIRLSNGAMTSYLDEARSQQFQLGAGDCRSLAVLTASGAGLPPLTGPLSDVSADTWAIFTHAEAITTGLVYELSLRRSLCAHNLVRLQATRLAIAAARYTNDTGTALDRWNRSCRVTSTACRRAHGSARPFATASRLESNCRTSTAAIDAGAPLRPAPA